MDNSVADEYMTVNYENDDYQITDADLKVRVWEALQNGASINDCITFELEDGSLISIPSYIKDEVYGKFVMMKNSSVTNVVRFGNNYYEINYVHLITAIVMLILLYILYRRYAGSPL